MLSPPTDRLHKFLAIAGVSLVLVGITYPLQKFQEAEISRIEAFEKSQLFAQAYGRYAEKVNAQIAIYNELVKNGITREQAQPRVKRIIETLPEIDKLDREVQDNLVQSQKQISLAEHYHFMRNVWFSIGLCCVLGGIFLCYIGFKQWLSQSKFERSEG